jgi:hypothetical protein
MTDHTKDDRFAMFMLTISETFDVEFSEVGMRIWAKALAKFDIADIERALEAHIADSEKGFYKPLPATIIRQIEGTKRNRSEAAAAMLIFATTLASARQGVSFADPIINAAVSQTRGWMPAYYCLVNPTTADDYLSEFKAAYERLSGSGGAHPAYLPGRNDDETFVVIGDEEAVDHVVRTGYNPKKPPPVSYLSFIQITN